MVIKWEKNILLKIFEKKTVTMWEKKCVDAMLCWPAISRYSGVLHAYMNGNVLWLLQKCIIENMLG